MAPKMMKMMTTKMKTSKNKFVAGSWMDGGATSVEVSVLKILISVLHNSFAFYLFSFNIAISLNSKYVTSVCVIILLS